MKRSPVSKRWRSRGALCARARRLGRARRHPDRGEAPLPERHAAHRPRQLRRRDRGAARGVPDQAAPERALQHRARVPRRRPDPRGDRLLPALPRDPPAGRRRGDPDADPAAGLARARRRSSPRRPTRRCAWSCRAPGPLGARATRRTGSSPALVERLEGAIARAEARAQQAAATPVEPATDSRATERAVAEDEEADGAVPYEELVVTASRRAQSSLEAPNASTVITADEIRLSGRDHRWSSCSGACRAPR